METMEGVSIEVDSEDTDGLPQAVAYLTLIGDFVSTCEEYLGNDQPDDPGYDRFTVKIPRNIAEDLHKQLEKVLFDR